MIRARLGGWPAAVLLLWLVAAIVLIVVMRDAIPGGWLKDTDDYMRLMEVRDWLAGQSWYDVSQHRLNPPEGAMMHWTRLVDLPLAAGFLLLTPLLGSVWAENVTMVAVPLLLLLATMITLGWMISRLVDAPGAAEIGPALMLFSPFTIMQFMPLRIDHHGWQILMAALASAALLADRRLRGGIIAGLALGFWLTVSLEGLPFAAICLGAVGLRWCFDSSEASRLASLAATLALSAAAFFLITIPPSAWGRTFCDATSAGQLGALATAAAGIAMLTRSPLASTALQRIIGLALVAAASGGMLALIAPQCLSGPFSRLDPVVYDMWYVHVREGLPVWRLSPDFGVQLLFMPAIALAGSLWQRARAADDAMRWRWTIITLLLAGGTAMGMLVLRSGSLAAILAVPGAIAVASGLLVRVRAAKSAAIRIIGTAGTLLLPTPLAPAFAVSLLAPAEKTADETVDANDANDAAALEAISRLPRAIIFAPFDATPRLIARTGQSAVAGPYHRNDRALAEVIRAFTSPEEAARRIVLRHRASYVLSLDSPEFSSYRDKAANGLAACLADGRPPAWLEPVKLPAGNLKLWRVVQ
jgi:hypothetical protein